MKLFGPVLLYDLIRMARRTRYLLLRGLYPILLLCILTLMYYGEFGTFAGAVVSPGRIADFASRFFYTFMAAQFVFVLVMTPAYLAGAVAEEKQRRTLEFLMATDLRNQEVVLSKLLSRLGNLVLFFLGGLPVLSMIQLFGGVDPGLLWSGFAATGLTMLSLACLTMLYSVYARRGREALLWAYLTMVAYYGLWGVFAFLRSFLVRNFSPSYEVWLVLDTAYGAYNWGNLFEAVADVSARSGINSRLLLERLWKYAAFHGVIAVLATGLAVLRLRRVFVRQTYEQAEKPSRWRRGRRRPRMGLHPMIWKEVYSEPGLRLGWMGKIIFVLLCLACLTPGLLIIANYLHTTWVNPSYSSYSYWRSPLDQFRLAMNIYVRIVSTLLSCFLLLGIAIRAASSIGAERDKQTLDSLLAAPLSDAEIIFAKWLGSIASMHWLFGLLCAVWFIGVVTGGLHVVAVPALIVELAIYGGFMAALGMFFAATTKSSLWAVLETVNAALLIGGGHWMCCGWIAFAIGNDMASRWPVEFLAGLTPPFVLLMTGIRSDEFHHPYGPPNRLLYEILNFCLLGLFLFAGGAAGLWLLALKQFQRTSGRISARVAPQPILRPVDSPQRIHK